MAKSNQRIIKKLSSKAAKLFPKVDWDKDDSEPYCEWWDELLPRTPILWYRASYEYSESESICGWAVLKRVFMNERDSTIHGEQLEWLWGRKPTPRNVFFWAFWNPDKLEKITNSYFGY
ncbi:hypothetical protein ACVP6W_003484 [Vibrio cholerae]|nr:hypothetical protein [Vibrio cholerae]